ncbi:DoxX family protein [Granulicella sp. L56]|uniref:DoxX family protein n=1 Tax=Granulicella sp. L56 TaxID=1747222 RepID=UPI00131E40AA|nr:DoxX family protein [Granulicella sp. L56]
MIRFLNNLQPWGALFLRLALGLSMIGHGYQKVSSHAALHHFVHYIVTLGFPYWLGYISAFTEFVGGIVVVLGLFTRLASGLIAINMLVALFTVGIHQGFSGYNYISDLAAIALMLCFYGAGALSIDRRLGLS